MTPKRVGTLSLALCSLSLATGSAWGQESLLDIYQRALQNDPAIREAEAAYLAAAEAKPQARSALLPGLSLGAARSHTFVDIAGGAVVGGTGEVRGTGQERETDQNSWSLNVTQTVFDWGQFQQLKQADKILARAQTEFELARQDLLIRVANAYFNVLAAEDTLASQVAAREAIGRQLEQAQRRFEVGLIAITDVQDAQAGYDDAVAAEIEAQRQLATTQEFLREIIGEYVTELAGPVDDLPLLTPDPANVDEWVETALRQNLALISTRITADIAQDAIGIQRAARLPTVSLTAGYNDSRSDQLSTIFFDDGTGQTLPSLVRPEGYNWSLDIRVPLYTGGFNRSRIRQSVYEHRAALEAVERVQRQTERATRDAFLGVTSSISRVRALRQAVESARTALRANEAGFEVGTRTTVDVLLAQNQLRLAETQYARSRYDYIMNVLLLQEAAGGLTVEDVEQIDSWLQQ
ncbi:MAG TPA: TolC family outer membrane protein [Gammaproteobacteria bacterium]